MATENAPKSLFCSLGSENTTLSDDEIKTQLFSFLDLLGPREDIMLLPPDFTRFHSQAGKLTRFICEYYNFVDVHVNDPSKEEDNTSIEKEGEDSEIEPATKKAKTQQLKQKSDHSPDITILPALGTHFPMTKEQIQNMFGENLAKKEPSPFLVHDWRKDVETIGHAPASMVEKATDGMVSRPWPAQLNHHVWSRRKHDPENEKQPHKSLVLSIGQVVPHEGEKHYINDA